MTSLYSATMSPAKDSLSSPHLRPSNISKPPLRALYDLLIAPMEGVRARVFFFLHFFLKIHQTVLAFIHSKSCRLSPQGLMHSSGPVGRHRQLVLVLEGELYLIPFALLKGSSSNEYLYERFSLISVPSLGSLRETAKVRRLHVSEKILFQSFCFLSWTTNPSKKLDSTPESGTFSPRFSASMCVPYV